MIPCFVRISWAFLAVASLPQSLFSEEAAKPEKSFQRVQIARLQPGTVIRALRISQDGRHVAQVVVDGGGKQRIWVNDHQGPEYDAFIQDSLHFSSDAKHVTYGAFRGDERFVVVDGTEYPGFEGCVEGSPVFSPDGKRFAYFAAQGKKIVPVVDGVVWEAWDSLSRAGISFTADSQHFAFVAKDGNDMRVVIDNVPGQKFHMIAGFSFGLGSAHHAYIAIHEDESMSLMVNGKKVLQTEAFVHDTLKFDDANTLHVLALKKSTLTRIEVDARNFVE